MDYEDYSDYSDQGPNDIPMTPEEIMERYGISEEELAAMYQEYGTGEGTDMLDSSYNEPLPRPALYELAEHCIGPSLTSLSSQISTVILLCLISRFLSRNPVFSLPPLFVHLVMTVCGTIASYSILEQHCYHLLGFVATSYCVLYLSSLIRRPAPGRWAQMFMLLVCLAFVMIGELGLEATTWQRMRGSQMIMMMKAISVGCDVTMHGNIDYLPSAPVYASYLLNPGSVVFGPWVSLKGYRIAIQSMRSDFPNVLELFHAVKSLAAGVTCLLISTCVGSWIIRDDWGAWPTAYRDAQSFRFSHYFVGYVSAFTFLLAVGAPPTQTKHTESTERSVAGDLVVTRPLSVEFPRSFVEIVTAWDIPMHHWLKQYVFKSARSTFGTFGAIMATYAASALLHGVNFQLSAVLFSLGLYSYVEFMLRKTLANAFDACLEARVCRPGCEHAHTARHWGVMVTNAGFVVLNMFHLAYLGVMFDNSDGQDKGYDMRHTLSKWAKLDYLSHIIVGITYVFYWAVK